MKNKNKGKNDNPLASAIHQNEASRSEKPNTKKKNSKYDEVKSAVKSKEHSINPVWNVQLGVNQVAELYAIQGVEHYSSRTEALQLLLDKAKHLIIKSSKDKDNFNTLKKSFLIQNKAKAIRQYRKYHEK